MRGRRPGPETDMPGTRMPASRPRSDTDMSASRSRSDTDMPTSRPRSDTTTSSAEPRRAVGTVLCLHRQHRDGQQ